MLVYQKVDVLVSKYFILHGGCRPAYHLVILVGKMMISQRHFLGNPMDNLGTDNSISDSRRFGLSKYRSTILYFKPFPQKKGRPNHSTALPSSVIKHGLEDP